MILLSKLELQDIHKIVSKECSRANIITDDHLTSNSSILFDLETEGNCVLASGFYGFKKDKIKHYRHCTLKLHVKQNSGWSIKLINDYF